MKNNNKNTGFKSLIFGKKKKYIWIAAIIIVAIIVYIKSGKKKDEEGGYLTETAHIGPLSIDITESGNIETSGSLVLRSEVEGRTTIISIIPEGTILTDNDVKNKKLLIELDSSELRKKLDQQLITFEGQKAQVTDAKANYDIQINQNESDKKDGELKLTFARMDLEKYIGNKLVDEVIKKQINYEELIKNPDLGGESLQKKRELGNKIFLAEEELSRAKVKLEWTQKLFDKGYVTGDDLQSDKLSVKRQEIALESAKTSLDLFEKYEFRKDIEKYKSEYEEAGNKLERVLSKNLANVAKMESKLKSEEASYKQQSDQIDKLNSQIEKCKIYSTKPGLVVYAGGNRMWDNEQIKEGTEVRERQDLIEIPNLQGLLVETKIHESDISRVKKGQNTEVTIDAMPDKLFKGKVTFVGLLPDNENRWLNPNLKVYSVKVEMDNAEETAKMKPGMSTKVKILINKLDKVLQIPLQAVRARGVEKVCWVSNSFGMPEMRTVKVGEYNQKYIEIKEGLKEGEKVILNSAALNEESKKKLEKEKKEKGEIPGAEQGAPDNTGVAPADANSPKNAPSAGDVKPAENGSVQAPSGNEKGMTKDGEAKPADAPQGEVKSEESQPAKKEKKEKNNNAGGGKKGKQKKED